MTKVCRKCGRELDLEEFPLRKNAKDGHRNECKQCKKVFDHIYHQDNKEHNKQVNKVWRERNPEKCQATYARYRKTEKRRKVNREWSRNNRDHIQAKRLYRYHNDEEFNLVTKIRRRIYMAISKQQVTKENSSGKLLGCTSVELHQYILSKLSPEMDISDLDSGKIHLDHIKPCCQFNLLDPVQQYICFNYRNLQPLYAVDNLQKSGMWSVEDEAKWRKEIWPKIKENMVQRGIIDSSYEGC